LVIAGGGVVVAIEADAGRVGGGAQVAEVAVRRKARRRIAGGGIVVVAGGGVDVAAQGDVAGGAGLFNVADDA